MTNNVNNNFSSIDFDAIAKKQQTEKQDAQKAAQNEFENSIWGGGLKSLTGIDSHNFGLFDSSASKNDSVLTGVGQVIASPLHVGGGILGGLLGAVGKLLSPIFGILGGILGGGQQAQPAQPGAPQQPQQPQQPQSPSGKTSGGSTTSAGSTTGGASTSESDSTSESSSTTKSGSAKSGKNAENRTIGTHYDFDKSQHVANFETGGAEKYSTFAGAMVEELNDSTKDLETLQNEKTSTENEISSLKAKNKDVQADAKTKAKAQMTEYKSAMDTYQGQLDGIARDIEAQESLKSQYPDRKDEIEKTISALKAQQQEVTKGFKDAKAKYEKAEQDYNKANNEEAKSDTPQAKLAQLEAKLERINQRIAVAEARDEKVRKGLTQACEDEKARSQKDDYDPSARKAEAQKFTSALDGAESKAKGVKSSDTARLSAQETIARMAEIQKAGTADSSKEQGNNGVEQKDINALAAKVAAGATLTPQEMQQLTSNIDAVTKDQPETVQTGMKAMAYLSSHVTDGIDTDSDDFQKQPKEVQDYIKTYMGKCGVQGTKFNLEAATGVDYNGDGKTINLDKLWNKQTEKYDADGKSGDALWAATASDGKQYYWHSTDGTTDNEFIVDAHGNKGNDVTYETSAGKKFKVTNGNAEEVKQA